MLEEIWKDIPSYEGYYQVSSLGRIRSIGRIKKILRFIVEKKGYLAVSLCVSYQRKIFTVHRIVANVFIPNPLGLSDVNHKNGNKKDNSLNNLEWLSHKDNVRHAMETGITNYIHRSKLTEDDVLNIDRLYFVEKWNMQDISKMYGMEVRSIRNILKRKIWKHVKPDPSIERVFRSSYRESRYNKKGNNSKLQVVDVIKIKALLRDGVDKREIANLFGVGRHCIYNISREKLWRHVA